MATEEEVVLSIIGTRPVLNQLKLWITALPARCFPKACCKGQGFQSGCRELPYPPQWSSLYSVSEA